MTSEPPTLAECLRAEGIQTPQRQAAARRAFDTWLRGWKGTTGMTADLVEQWEQVMS